MRWNFIKAFRTEISAKALEGKRGRKNADQPRAGVALVQEHIDLLTYLQDKAAPICFRQPSTAIPDRIGIKEAEVGILGVRS